MAAWAQTTNGGHMQRKKWNLQDDSLQKLKAQMAQEGCSDLEYDLGKQLIGECDDDHQARNSQAGINWLLRAANQGHEQALRLLTECFSSGRGINESNEYDVRLCLEMSPTERAARKAARELFLCLSNGGEFITATQLENKMREIYQMDNSNRRLGQSSRPPNRLDHNSGEILTESNLITAAINYSNAELPTLNLCVPTRPHPDSLGHIPAFYRPLFHPVLFFTILYHRVLRLANLPGLLWQHKVPVIMLIYLVASSKDKQMFLQLVPTAVYLISIVVMVIATLRMLQSRHEFMDFRLWYGLFQHFGGELALYRDVQESNFLRKNLRPYLFFFVALLASLLLRPVVKSELLPCAEIAIVALSLAFLSALVFMCCSVPRQSSRRSLFPNVLIVLSLLANVLAKYPYDIVESSWHLFDSLILPFGHSITSGIELRLNFTGVFYLLIPVLLIQIASMEKWRGVYKYLIPHLVTLTWMQIGMAYAHDSTLLGLLRAIAELMTTVLFLPLLGLATMMLPLLTAVEAFLIDQRLKIIAFIVLAITLVIVYGYLSSSHKWSKWLVPIQITVYSIVIFTLVVPYLEKNLKLLEGEAVFQDEGPLGTPIDAETYKGMSWESYSKYCHTSKPYSNRVQSQVRCSQLDGEFVRWEGAVNSVEILQVHNLKRDLLGFVYPRVVRNILTCFFGEANAVDCGQGENDCAGMQQHVEGRWRCNLNKWDTYTYLVRMRMKSPSSTLLLIGHFGNLTHLTQNDKLWFEGGLLSRDRTIYRDVDEPPATIIELQRVGCVSCKSTNAQFEQPHSPGSVSSLLVAVQGSFKHLLNAIFNPVLIFK